jgi:two-component sensor histidine kinase
MYLTASLVKYGALSRDPQHGSAGSVTIKWKIEDKYFHMVWSEHGGPEVVPPAQSGFGTSLIERVLAQDLGGQVTLEFPPDGVVCTIQGVLADMAPEMTGLQVVNVGKEQ